MNAPDRFELFLLGDDEKKIEEKVQSNIPNCSDFWIKKEDHTIGNLVSEHLKQHPNVLMAGYKSTHQHSFPSSQPLTDLSSPHPNVPELFVRVQTNGSITPREAFMEACRMLLRMLKQLSQAFTREWELRRMVTAGDQKQGI